MRAQLPPSLWSSRAPASVACECVRAEGQGDTSQVWSGLPRCLGSWVPRWASAASGSGFSGSGLEPQKPNQTIELISQIGGPPGQIRPFLSM